MGKSSDGNGEAKGLTDQQKRNIREKFEEYGLTPDEIGPSLDALFALIDLALKPVPANYQDFGISDRAKFDSACNDVTKHMAQLITAVHGLAAVMPPEEGQPGFEAALAEMPWLRDIDHFEGTIADIVQGDSDREHVFGVVKLIRDLAVVLKSIEKPKAKPGPRQKVADADLVIRAICIYRHKSGMAGAEFWWGQEYVEPADNRSGRINEKPIPTSDVGRLVAAIADGLGLAESNANLKTSLAKYGKEMTTAERKPQIDDLFFR